MWSAVVGLEEATKLVQAVAPHLTTETAQNVRRDAEDRQEQAKLVRKILNELKAYRLEVSG